MKQALQKAVLTLVRGKPSEFKEAKKQIERLWHKKPHLFRKAAPFVFKYLKDFYALEPVNQAAFCSGLSFFYSALADEHFDLLEDFTLKVMQNPLGHVREAIRKTALWLDISLSSRMDPFVYPAGTPLTREQVQDQKEARRQYQRYKNKLEDLIERYNDETDLVEYIDQMKPSVNKSVQMLYADLTRREYSEHQERATSPEILAKRKEIEGELLYFLKETGSEFTLDHIKRAIYNEDDINTISDLLSMFDCGQGGLELQNILEVINDAWNYFPHKSLSGLSPVEKLEEYHRGQDNLEP